jgi:hypothetical protein
LKHRKPTANLSAFSYLQRSKTPYVITASMGILMHINDAFALQQYPCLIHTRTKG